MWPLFTICALAVASGYFLVSREVQQAAVTTTRAERFLASNMSTYRSMVVNYVREHPGAVVDGSIDDEVLVYPPWYTRHPQWRNHVVGSRVVVVYSNVPDAVGLADELVALSKGSILAGRARPASAGGASALTLHSPGRGDTGIAMPAVVPEGSAVWVATLE